MRSPILFFFILSLTSSAQIPTGSEIWTLDMSKNKESYSFKNPVNITNREGYDNQPAFSPDGKYILYASIREDNQSDIYKYDLQTKVTSQLTKTPESEFSPTFTPDNIYISAVRVEQDSTQRLWKFNLDGNNPLLVNPSIDSIGYHCWLNGSTFVVFILTHPFTLITANTNNSITAPLANNAGRSFRRFQDNTHIIFTQDIDSIKWICITGINEKSKPVVKALEKSEDFVLINNQIVFMAAGSQLYKFDILKDKIWQEIGNFNMYNIQNITRIAVNTDATKIAIVSNK